MSWSLSILSGRNLELVHYWLFLYMKLNHIKIESLLMHCLQACHLRKQPLFIYNFFFFFFFFVHRGHWYGGLTTLPMCYRQWNLHSCRVLRWNFVHMFLQLFFVVKLSSSGFKLQSRELLAELDQGLPLVAKNQLSALLLTWLPRILLWGIGTLVRALFCCLLQDMIWELVFGLVIGVYFKA